MTPEEEARQIIDEKLEACGWKVQDRERIDLSAARGIAVREFTLKSGHGESDYLLYVDGKALGVIEAKPVGHTLIGVEEQAARYSTGLPDHLPAWRRPLPFKYESTGKKTRFTNDLEPDARSRDVFHFHRPETLLEYVQQDEQLRGRLRGMPELNTKGLWRPQIRAINNVERSLAHGRPKALIQMATGSGKTFMAAHLIYRLIKFADARRILFLVDRRNLGQQTLTEFSQLRPPDDGRRFADIYNIQFLRKNTIDKASRVTITTVQRMYSMLRGEEDVDAGIEDGSLFDASSPLLGAPSFVEYNPKVPIESFDFIVVDECHRSIYNLWSQVLEYFDAFLIGMTATPSMNTIGYFDRNLVMEYTHPEAVADKVNVNYDVYRIRTKITEEGADVESGVFVGKRDRMTRETRYEALDDDLTYTANDLDRDVVSVDQIRTVVRTFRDKLATAIFPGRVEVPKTLVFAKDDWHADDIVKIMREEFGKSNEFCQKITYRTGFVRVLKEGAPAESRDPSDYTWQRASSMTPDDVLGAFRTAYNPRIAVTVDMIATGTDVKPLEIVMFMRNVKSANFFEQMKGRGVRVIHPDVLRSVTPDAKSKTHFIIVDCVGVCEQDKTESKPLNRQPSVPLKALLNNVAQGDTRDDTLSTLAARLARLQCEITVEQESELTELAGGATLADITGALVHAVDPNAQVDAAQAKLSEGKEPTETQIEAAAEKLKQDAVKPLHNPDFRRRLLEIRTVVDQTIDHVTPDEVLEAGFDAQALDKAKGRIESFRKWIEENKDEIDALRLIYSRRYANRIKFDDVKDLAGRITRPPLSATTAELWWAYEALDRSKVRGNGGQQLADIVSIIRHTVESDDVMEPFGDIVMERFEPWLAQQQDAGAGLTDEQAEWLRKIAEHIATSVVIERDDFEYGWFAQHGSLGRAYELFGDQLDQIMAELNEKLVA